MATNYLVAWDADPARGIERGTFGCSARGPAEAIGEFEKSLHARALPRDPLEVRAYGPEQNPLQAPSREDALQASVIEPAPFRIRYGEPRLGPAARAEIAVEIDGRYCGKLREVDAPDGAGWRAFSPRGELDGLGPPPPPEWPAPDPPPMTLAEACRGIERLAAAERERWKSDPGWHLPPPAPHRSPPSPDPDRTVRFTPPVVNDDGRASVGVEINGRLSASLKETHPGDEGAPPSPAQEFKRIVQGARYESYIDRKTGARVLAWVWPDGRSIAPAEAMRKARAAQGREQETAATPGEGSRWCVSWSQLPIGQLRIAELDRIGKSKPLSLGEACREVEAAVRSCHPRTSAAERARAATTAPATRERCR